MHEFNMLYSHLDVFDNACCWDDKIKVARKTGKKHKENLVGCTWKGKR